MRPKADTGLELNLTTANDPKQTYRDSALFKMVDPLASY